MRSGVIDDPQRVELILSGSIERRFNIMKNHGETSCCSYEPALSLKEGKS